MHRAADQIIGLEVGMRQGGQPQALAQRLAPRKLSAQLRRGRVAVGFVGGIQGIAKTTVQRFIEGDGDVLRVLAFQQIQ